MGSQKPEVCVIVLSYNRPRMLHEAMRSIKGADEIIVLDDASSFDAGVVARSSDVQCCRLSIRVASSVTIDERMRTPRLGKAINEAVRSTKCDIIAYLCDDDLFHEGWLPSVKDFFASASEDIHWMKAAWGMFSDGDEPGDMRCSLGEHGMTTGNFAHRRSCAISHGPRWDESRVVGLDHALISDLNISHPWGKIPTLTTLAGWRRMHPHNMLEFTNGAIFTSAARKILSGGMLEQ